MQLKNNTTYSDGTSRPEDILTPFLDNPGLRRLRSLLLVNEGDVAMLTT